MTYSLLLKYSGSVRRPTKGTIEAIPNISIKPTNTYKNNNIVKLFLSVLSKNKKDFLSNLYNRTPH